MKRNEKSYSNILYIYIKYYKSGSITEANPILFIVSRTRIIKADLDALQIQIRGRKRSSDPDPRAKFIAYPTESGSTNTAFNFKCGSGCRSNSLRFRSSGNKKGFGSGSLGTRN